jgi:hypothetical protein
MSRNAGSRSSSIKAPPSNNPSSSSLNIVHIDLEKITIPLEVTKPVILKAKIENEQSPRRSQGSVTPKALDKSAYMPTPKKNLFPSYNSSSGKVGSETSSTTGSSKNYLHTPDESRSPNAVLRDGSQRKSSKNPEKRPGTQIMTIDLNRITETKTALISKGDSQDTSMKKV